jgi:hypothetical protein
VTRSGEKRLTTTTLMPANDTRAHLILELIRRAFHAPGRSADHPCAADRPDAEIYGGLDRHRLAR